MAEHNELLNMSVAQLMTGCWQNEELHCATPKNAFPATWPRSGVQSNDQQTVSCSGFNVSV